MKKAELIDEVDSVLKKAGYKVSKRFLSRRCCFDIVAVKGTKSIFMKLAEDLRKVQRCCSQDLQSISLLFSGTPLFIGGRSRKTPLKDDTVYERYSVNALTVKTLDLVTSENSNPLIIAGPGGYYVNVDGKGIRNRRRELGLSIGKLAEIVGVSRGTIYSYERGVGKATVSTGYKLGKTLGVPIIKPIDPLRSPLELSVADRPPKNMVLRNDYLRRVYGLLVRSGCPVEPVRRAPFDFVVEHSDEDRHVIGCVSKTERKGSRRIREILDFSSVVNAKCLILTDGKCRLEADVPYISIEDLEQMEEVGELLQ